MDPVGELSGGERRRLQLLRLLMGEPNVLLLDEPTNDLDIETLTELEDMLDGWPGTLVVVSHDRYFLERVTEHVVALLGDGGCPSCRRRRRVPGPHPDRPPGSPADRARARRRPAPPRSRGRGAGRAQGTPAAGTADRPAHRPRERAPRQMAENATDYEKLTLGAELRAVQAEKADLEERWLSRRRPRILGPARR